MKVKFKCSACAAKEERYPALPDAFCISSDFSLVKSMFVLKLSVRSTI